MDICSPAVGIDPLKPLKNNEPLRPILTEKIGSLKNRVNNVRVVDNVNQVHR